MLLVRFFHFFGREHFNYSGTVIVDVYCLMSFAVNLLGLLHNDSFNELVN